MLPMKKDDLECTILRYVRLVKLGDFAQKVWHQYWLNKKDQKSEP